MSEIYTPSWKPLSENDSHHYQYQDETGAVSNIFMYEHRFSGVDVFYATSRQDKMVKMTEYQQIPVLNLYFSLEGHCGAHCNTPLKSYPIQDMRHTVRFTPEFDGYYTIESAVVRNFGISLSESFFHRLVSNDLECLKAFWEKVHAGKMVDMTPQAMPVTSEQLQVIKAIQECTYSGTMKQLFFESKIIELFLLQAEQAGKFSGIKEESLLSRDLDKLYVARTFIEAHMFEPLTLLQVARNCGLNDFKLKKGFKEVFGTTVFGYLNALKMDYGQQLLRDTSFTVSEVAHILGYTDPYNFSKAFRNYFGYLPGTLLKKKTY